MHIISANKGKMTEFLATIPMNKQEKTVGVFRCASRLLSSIDILVDNFVFPIIPLL